MSMQLKSYNLTKLNMSYEVKQIIPPVGNGLHSNHYVFGDINGNGKSELLLSFYAQDPKRDNLIVLLDIEDLPQKLDFNNLEYPHFKVTTSDTYYGGRMALCDLNNDGVKDIVWGAFYTNKAAGEVSVIYGHKDLVSDFNVDDINGFNGFKIKGLTAGERFGVHVLCTDHNKDSIDDLVISAYSRSGEASQVVIFGNNNPTNSQTYFDISQQNSSRFISIYPEKAGDVLGYELVQGGLCHVEGMVIHSL